MADQVKQLAFKSFTTTELQNGTAANVLTTDASTHYVIKSIEGTQGSNDDAVSATATLGLTSGLSSGEFTSLGTVAKKDRVGLSGSAIMDASSTLTIRPVAKTITFTDEKIHQGLENLNVQRTFLQAALPQVNGKAETALNSETTIDKTSVTYSGGSYSTMYTNPYGNFTIYHTNANGVNLRIVFSHGGGSSCAFEVWNADGTYYGYYSDSYDSPLFDGERYIFWVAADGASTSRLKWYDLDESTTNLAAANTLGGASGRDFCHGQTAVFADSPSINSRSTYDNKMNAFYKNRHTDGKRYIVGYSGGNQHLWGVNVPETLTNDSSTTPAPKWIYLASGGSHQGGVDPFGNGSSMFNFNYMRQSSSGMTQYGTGLHLTYDKEKERYFLYFGWDDHKYAVFTWTQDEWDGTGQAGRLDQGTTGYGIRMVADSSASVAGLDSNVLVSYSGSNAQIRLRTEVYTRTNSTVQPIAQQGAVYIDGRNFYYKNDTSTTTATYRKCVKVNMASVSESNVTNMFPNTAISSNGYGPDLFVAFATPSSSTIAQRTYTVAPSLKVRVTGILADQ